MNRPGAGQAIGVAGIIASAAATAGVLAQVELSKQPKASIWSNSWLVTAVVLAGIAVVVGIAYLLSSMLSHEQSVTRAVSMHPSDDVARASAGEPDHEEEPAQPDGETRADTPAFTDLWRHTSDGFEATPLMNMAGIAMPGFQGVHGQEAELRIGVCVGCAPLPEGTSSSVLAERLLEFLRRDGPVARLLRTVPSDTISGLKWTRQAGNGALSLEAVLSSESEDSKPSASVLFQPAHRGMRLHGRPEDTACLWVHADPCGMNGRAVPAGFALWYERFKLVPLLGAAFADFLSRDLGLRTTNSPAARAGMVIQGPNPISDLVDPGGMHPLPGAIVNTQFLAYAIADRAGSPADQIARDFFRQFCDHTLHLPDCDTALERASAVSRELFSTWDAQDQQGQARRVSRNLWCVRCGFPFLKAQRNDICEISNNIGNNFCKRRARTKIESRQQQMRRKPDTPYRVHQMWADQHPDRPDDGRVYLHAVRDA